jgi:hypothetical protein
LGSKSPLGDFFPAGTPARFCKTLKNQWKYCIFEAKIAKTHHATGVFALTAAGPLGAPKFNFFNKKST